MHRPAAMCMALSGFKQHTGCISHVYQRTLICPPWLVLAVLQHWAEIIVAIDIQQVFGLLILASAQEDVAVPLQHIACLT